MNMKQRQFLYNLATTLAVILLYNGILQKVRYLYQMKIYLPAVLFAFVVLYAAWQIRNMILLYIDNRKVRYIWKRVYSVMIFAGIILSWAVYLCYAYLEKKNDVTIKVSELDTAINEDKQQQLNDNYEELCMLIPENYVDLSREERIEVLVLVIRIEASYLGVNPPELEIAEMNGKLHGLTNADGTRITLNSNILEQEREVLATVLHEIYHIYQAECIRTFDTQTDLLWSRQVETWKEEKDKDKQYGDINEKYTDYYISLTEQTARDYAEERMQLYTDVFKIAE